MERPHADPANPTLADAVNARRAIRVMLCASLSVLAAAAGAPDRAGAAAPASEGGGFRLSWTSIDAGSPQRSAAPGFSVRGAIGQPDSGSVSGGRFRIDGGFWSAASTPPIDARVFFDGFEGAP
jgi:hypothetical protein